MIMFTIERACEQVRAKYKCMNDKVKIKCVFSYSPFKFFSNSSNKTTARENSDKETLTSLLMSP